MFTGNQLAANYNVILKLHLDVFLPNIWIKYHVSILSMNHPVVFLNKQGNVSGKGSNTLLRGFTATLGGPRKPIVYTIVNSKR